MADTAIPLPTRRPPLRTNGLVGWLRENLFNSWLNAFITLFLTVGLVWFVQGILNWFVTSDGWQAVLNNQRLLMAYVYPADALWRVELSAWIVITLLGLSAGVWKGTPRMVAIGLGLVLAVALIIPTLAPPSGIAYQIPPHAFLLGGIALIAVGYFIGDRLGMRLRWPLLIAWIVSIPLSMVGLLYGVQPQGVTPLGEVPTNLWGGLMLTLVLTFVGIVASFPLGILLALGRRSSLPIVRIFCTLYIEIIRGLPLVTVFFMGQLVLPLFLPQGWDIDNLIRAMVAATLFSAAYLAENVRGGLQSLPKGQHEAAQALGLNYFQATLLITLPQALRAIIPALVGQFISLFKDTSLVSIIGLFDLLNMAKVVQTQPEWLGIPGGVWRETLFYVAVIYFIFSFAMSRVSLRIERDLGVGQR